MSRRKAANAGHASDGNVTRAGVAKDALLPAGSPEGSERAGLGSASAGEQPRLTRRLLLAGALASPMLIYAPADATVGARASAFRLRSVTGTAWRGSFDLARYLGKRPVLISFFATWCRPCANELPFLQKLYQQHEKRGLMVVAVSIDGAQTASEIAGLVNRLGIKFPVLHDADSRVSARYNPRNAAPFLVSIDRKGRIVREREGWNGTHRKHLPQEVERLLGSKKPG